MKISEIIAEVDAQKPNQYSDADKIKWISTCEGKIIDSVLKKHTPVYSDTFSGYDVNSMDTDLLVPDTYCDVYKYYVFAMIDATNGELKRYEGSMNLYNAMLKDYTDMYNRTHAPIKTAIKVM